MVSTVFRLNNTQIVPPPREVPRLPPPLIDGILPPFTPLHEIGSRRNKVPPKKDKSN